MYVCPPERGFVRGMALFGPNFPEPSSAMRSVSGLTAPGLAVSMAMLTGVLPSRLVPNIALASVVPAPAPTGRLMDTMPSFGYASPSAGSHATGVRAPCPAARAAPTTSSRQTATTTGTHLRESFMA